ncbi:MAG TPA: FprA family A-type flavoprotein, partial [Pontiellaceae bacterium]|nr:FprA family A-type flavoprotein [Pontiellaceae bacterium]HPR83289.1 FprA family A-type flavoprotein [Pontiellaceae bacterium]
MSKIAIKNDIFWVGALDPDRKVFDGLLPLPQGTTYNSYLVVGSEKTALIDTVEPEFIDVLLANLEGVKKIDYIVSHHAEQDHSGSIPVLLEKYPEATLLCLQKNKEMLKDLMTIPDDRIQVVQDGGEVSLGNKTIRFMFCPWVHWPETAITYIPEDKILFPCDFLGSHHSFTTIFAGDNPAVYKGAKEYYVQIMMLYSKMTAKYLDRIKALDIEYICPSHGSVYDKPQIILGLYEKWMRGEPENLALIAYVSTHGSTKLMAEHLQTALEKRGVNVELKDLVTVPLNELAGLLTDAATIVLGSSVVMAALHPVAVNTAFLLDRLKPKAKFAAVIGSYGWSPGPLQKAAELLPSWKVDVVGAVITKGHPGEQAMAELDALADTIAAKHRGAGILK